MVGNSPISSFDYLGLAISVGHEKCNILITIPITIFTPSYERNHGMPNLSNVAQRIKTGTERYWNKEGGWKVENECCTVSFVADVRFDSISDRPIDVDAYTDSARQNAAGNQRNIIGITARELDDSHVSRGTFGLWSEKDDSWVYAHEVGHLMGLPDDYVNLGRDANGNRLTQYIPEHKGHMMGAYLGRVDQHEVNAVIEKNNIKCPCAK